MMPAAKAFDPVLGIDVHIIQPPGPVPPVPVPHPFVGLLVDPMDFVPVVGASVMVNGIPRATAGTGAKAIPSHIPIGGVFVVPPGNDGEMFMGSSTVLMDGDPSSYLALPALTCQSVGMPSPPRFGKAKTKPKSLTLPTSVVLPIPMGAPVLIGGPPTVSMMALGMKAAFAGLSRLASSRLGQRLRRGFQQLRQRACRNMRPGFLKCTVLRAEPVHVVTGEVVVEQQDFALPWRVPLAWTRRYGSHQTRYGACGRGWETPADARLEFEPDGGVTFRDGGAGASVFAALPEPGAEPERELAAGATLGRTRGGDGTEWLVVRTRAGLRYCFAAPPWAAPWGVRELVVSHVMDGCDNWTQFVRGPDGLVEVRDNSGQRVVVGSRGGRVERLDLADPDTGALLPLVRYEYGGGVHAVDDLTAAVDALDAPYRFAYDDARRLVRHTDRVGLSFHYAYDGPGQDARCVRAWGDGGLYAYEFAFEPDAGPSLGRTRVRDSLGHVSTVEWDAATLLPLREVDPLGGETVWEYDAAGRCAAEVRPGGGRTEWEYDAGGAVVRETGPDGATVRTEYDAEGRPVVVTDPLGHRWLQEWDVRGLPLRRAGPRGGEWRYEHDERGDVTSVIDPLGHVSRLAHDAAGRLREMVTPLGNATRLEFDARGATTVRIDPLGHRTHYTYDVKGRLIGLTDPLGNASQYEYDAEDRPSRLRDAEGQVTELVHAGLGELVARRNPDGTRVRYRYDTEERLLGVENERGQRYRLDRDPLGRVGRVTDYWGQSTNFYYEGSAPLPMAAVDPLGRTTAYVFDGAGRLTSAAYDGGACDTFAYDLAGRLVLAANQDSTVSLRHDEEGNVVEERQRGFKVESAYDLRSRRVLRRSSAGHEVRFAYDASGLATAVDLDGAPLMRARLDARGLPVTESLLGGMERTFAWDAAGRLTGQRLLRGRGAVASHTYRYDAVGQLVERRDRRGVSERYTYDGLGRIAAQLDPAGSLERFLHDPAGDVLGDVTPATATGAPSARVARGANAVYEFDAAGNLVRRVNSRSAEARFRWDGANRLAEAVTESGETITFRYDALGRRVTKSIGGREIRFFWDVDHLLADEAVPRHPREFVHRPGTWEVLAAANGSVCHYENDQAGLPRAVIDASGVVVWMADYDARGQTTSVRSAAYDNPVRFQGQYHDDETGLSYNRFRYFDPAAAAFVSADPLGILPGPNPYEYAPNVWSWVDPLGLNCQTIDPRQVRFTQDSIKGQFRNGGSISDTAARLRSGALKPEVFPPIRLVERDGVLYTLDNRRLETFRRAGVPVPFRMATADEVADEWARKFTTRNQGSSIRVRGG